MKRKTWVVVLLALILALGFQTESREARAQELDDGAVMVNLDTASPDEIDRWWGAAGAVLCGAEIRLIRVAPEIGMNPYVLAAGIGGCLLALLDTV
jgi:hypothetical protein